MQRSPGAAAVRIELVSRYCGHYPNVYVIGRAVQMLPPHFQGLVGVANQFGDAANIDYVGFKRAMRYLFFPPCKGFLLWEKRRGSFC